MSDFVEQCRREWKRLGVPHPLAEEMATDLASDLGEAEAEGVSAEELLGSSASDPRAFAASWAAERGIIPAPASRDDRRRPRILVVFTVLAAIAMAFAAAALLTGQPKLSVQAVGNPRARIPAPPGFFVGPGHGRRVVLPPTNAAAPFEWILLFLAVAALGFAAWLWVNWSRRQPPAATA